MKMKLNELKQLIRDVALSEANVSNASIRTKSSMIQISELMNKLEDILQFLIRDVGRACVAQFEQQFDVLLQVWRQTQSTLHQD